MQLLLEEELQNIDKETELTPDKVQSLVPVILQNLVRSNQWKSLVNSTKSEVSYFFTFTLKDWEMTIN